MQFGTKTDSASVVLNSSRNRRFIVSATTMVQYSPAFWRRTSSEEATGFTPGLPAGALKIADPSFLLVAAWIINYSDLFT
jgi:hypothetical protein